ncbi:MAG: FtsX-like permease family protein [Elusimicrobiota bacterium]
MRALPFELFVALRYLKTKRKGLFTLVTTVIGVAGVSIGVAALLTTLSVMNGFQSDIQKKIVGAQAHLSVYAKMSEAKREKLETVLREEKDVRATAPFVLGQGIITFEERSTGIVVKGIDPAAEFKVNNLEESLTAGSWSALTGPAERRKDGSSSAGTGPGGASAAQAGIVLGEELARHLGVWLDETVVLISPQSLATPFGLVPAMKKFRIVGLLRTGYYEFDSATGYVSIKEAADFFKTPGGMSGIQARLRDLDDADAVSAVLQDRLGWDFTVRSFTQMNRTLFAALKLEKYVMFIILALIILVASLNIASNLILMGTEKLRDIGLLRAMGAAPAQIRKIFLWVGLLIGCFGVGFGVLLGLALCWVVWRYPIVELPADIYYLSRVPVQVEALDVLGVMVCGLALSVLATLYPAHRASKVDPIEAIHYG